MQDNIKKITSLNNSLIVKLAKLKDKKYRLEEKKFIVEGYHLVEEASKTSHLLAVIATSKDDLDLFNTQDKILVTTDIIKKLSSTINPQNILGIVDMNYQQLSIENDLKKTNLKVVMLDDINDPGNLGTLIRSAAALGYDYVISSPNSVDYYNDKTIRASQGSIFKIKLLKSPLDEAIKVLKENKVYIVGTSLKNSSPLSKLNKYNKLAVIFGNEAHGISEKILNLTDINICLPMKNDVESLNVSIASGIIMYELNR